MESSFAGVAVVADIGAVDGPLVAVLAAVSVAGLDPVLVVVSVAVAAIGCGAAGGVGVGAAGTYDVVGVVAGGSAGRGSPGDAGPEWPVLPDNVAGKPFQCGPCPSSG